MNTTPTPEFKLDHRTVETIRWSALWNAAASAIQTFAAYFSIYFVGGYSGELFRAFGGIARQLPVRQLINDALWGAIIGAIMGFLLSKFYTQIQDINKKFLGGSLNTFFKLLFYPVVVGSLLGFFLTSAASFYIGILPLLIIVGGSVLGGYVYAKMMTKHVGSLYS